MASLTAGTTFTDGVANDVTAAKLGALVTNATPTSGLIQDRTTETVVGVTDTLLIGDASDSNNLKKMTVANLLKAPIVSTSGTINSLTTGTTTSTAEIVTSGTIATLNSTNGTIATLNSTTSTITNLSATTSTFLGTITGSTNVVNIGSGQIYKDASGNVGIGITTGTSKLNIYGATGATNSTWAGGSDVLLLNNNGAFSEQAIAFQEGAINIGAKIGVKNTANGAYDIIFANRANTSATSSLTEKMRINSSGSVGIGTTSPAEALHVSVAGGNNFAGIRSQNNNVGTGIAGIEFSSDTTYSKAAIGLIRSNFNGVGSIVFYNSSSTGAADWSTSDERLRIDASGKVDVTGELEAKNVTVNVNTLATASGTQNLDFTSEGYLTHAITGNITYTASNYSAGRSLSIRITCDGTQRNLTFPASWVFVGSKPTAIAASKVAVLSITSFGSTEANTVAAYAVQT